MFINTVFNRLYFFDCKFNSRLIVLLTNLRRNLSIYFFIIWFFNNRIIYKLAAQVNFSKDLCILAYPALQDKIEGFWAVFINYVNLTFY